MVVKRFLLLILVLALASVGLAQTSNLTCSKNGNDVRLSWSGGTSPYHIVRATSPTFYYGNVLLGDAYPSSVLDDTNALQNQTTFFYDVSGGDEPPADENNPAQSPPIIATLTLNNGKPGDSVVIDGNNFGATPEENLISFGVYLADVTAAGTTQLTVIVPPETLTGPVTVSVGTLSSNEVMFYRKYGAASYSDLASICFEKGNGSVWVADRATVDKFIEVYPNETQTVRGGINENVMSDIDVSGTWLYYGNSSYSSANTCIVRRWNVGTDVLEVFRTIGVSGSDPVQLLAISPDPLTADRIVVSDGYRQTLRRVPKTGTIDHDFGNLGSVTFNNPAGLRFDSAGNLYATTSNALLKITPGEVVTTLLTGLNGAAGIDITERPGFPLILIAEENTGKVLLYNTESGIVETVATGLTQPSGVAFTEDLATGELFYDVIEPTRIIRLPDPVVEVMLAQPTRVLIHKYGSSDPYPSPYQTADGRIRIEVKLKGFQTVPSTVYFRAMNPDPDDDRGYDTDTAPDDNTDTTAPPANKYGELSASSASVVNGVAFVDLIITDRNAGDNYVVEISTSATFATIDARTAVITAWKRVYIEVDKMYASGEFITQESGASQPAGQRNRIYVANPASFSIGEEVHVVSGDYSQKKEHNTGQTMHVTDNTQANYIVVDGDLLMAYTVPLGPGEPPYSFVAHTSAGTYSSNLDVNLLRQTYDDSCVEYLVVNSGNSRLPLWYSIPGATPQERATYINNRSSYFFENYTDLTGWPFKNHIQHVSAAFCQPPPLPADATLGMTSGSNSALNPSADNWSWTFCQTIDTQTTYPDKALLRRDTDTHEIAHQHNVNYPDDPGSGGGHDTRAAWQGTDMCLMNELGRNRQDTIFQFCEIDARSIRNHTDDLNENQ